MNNKVLRRASAPLRAHPRITAVAVVCVAAVLAAIGFHAIYHPLRENPNAPRYADYVRVGPSNPQENTTVNTFAVELPIDGSNYRQLAGFADIIVAGTVTDVTEAGDLYGTPSSRVSIDVKTVLKGPPRLGRIEFLAEGGIAKRDGKVVITIPDGGRPISVGFSYILATRYSAQQHADMLIPLVGQIALSGEEADDLAATGGSGPGRVSAMRDAVVHQIPFR
jgi:hypothetical protein